jgi:hypothetical protein
MKGREGWRIGKMRDRKYAGWKEWRIIRMRGNNDEW